MAGSSVAACKAAIVAAVAQVVPASSLTSYGDPGEYQPAEIVAVMGTVTPVGRPTLGTNRSREEVGVTTIIVSIYVPGGPEAQVTATTRAYEIVGLLSDWWRTGTNAKLGGACYDSWINNYQDTPSVAYDPASGNATGRVCDIDISVIHKSRP